MFKQTVMTGLIERIRAQYESGVSTYGEQLAYEAILNDAEEMIKQEKEQMIRFAMKATYGEVKVFNSDIYDMWERSYFKWINLRFIEKEIDIFHL